MKDQKDSAILHGLHGTLSGTPPNKIDVKNLHTNTFSTNRTMRRTSEDWDKLSNQVRHYKILCEAKDLRITELEKKLAEIKQVLKPFAEMYIEGPQRNCTRCHCYIKHSDKCSKRKAFDVLNQGGNDGLS